jgi:hypothetical protein
MKDMAKKEKRSANAPKTPAADTPGKSRLELRFDPELNERIRSLADKASISVNQLIQGVMRWAVNNAVVGEPYRDEEGIVRAKGVLGCLFFGREGGHWEPGEKEDWERHYGEKIEGHIRDTGQLVFSLDFTERFVVRDDDESPRASGTTEKRGR